MSKYSKLKNEINESCSVVTDTCNEIIGICNEASINHQTMQNVLADMHKVSAQFDEKLVLW